MEGEEGKEIRAARISLLAWTAERRRIYTRKNALTDLTPKDSAVDERALAKYFEGLHVVANPQSNICNHIITGEKTFKDARAVLSLHHFQ